MIYADNAATTWLDEEAFKAMKPFLMESYGNPSQPYAFARKPRQAIRKARDTIETDEDRCAVCLTIPIQPDYYKELGSNDITQTATQGTTQAITQASRDEVEIKSLILSDKIQEYHNTESQLF